MEFVYLKTDGDAATLTSKSKRMGKAFWPALYRFINLSKKKPKQLSGLVILLQFYGVVISMPRVLVQVWSSPSGSSSPLGWSINGQAKYGIEFHTWFMLFFSSSQIFINQ